MKVEVYGGYHSPWVQAVLLALHDADVEHRVRQVPPFEAVKQWGVLMPAVSIDDGPWEIESRKSLASSDGVQYRMKTCRRLKRRGRECCTARTIRFAFCSVCACRGQFTVLAHALYA